MALRYACITIASLSVLGGCEIIDPAYSIDNSEWNKIVNENCFRVFMSTMAPRAV